MFPLKDDTPRRCLPVMTWALIAVNAAVFVLLTQVPQPELERLFNVFGVVPARFAHPGWSRLAVGDGLGAWSFLTCMFLHGGWLHIIGNMWILWIFGDNVEDEMGSLRFLAFYLLTGIAASVIHVVTNPSSAIPIVGASGAIAGVMGAYYTLFPRARVMMVVPILFFPFFFEVPAVFFLAFWFILQVFSGALALTAGAVGGIAWWAHVGGFLVGAGVNRFFLPGKPTRPCRQHRGVYLPGRTFRSRPRR